MAEAEAPVKVHADLSRGGETDGQAMWGKKMSQRSIDKFIGGYQIVAGSAGLLIALFVSVVALNSSLATATQKLSIAFVGLVMVAVFAGVVLAGVLLLEGQPAGRVLSSGLQLLQIPIVVSASWHWLFFAGAYLELAWISGESQLSFGLKADLEFAWGGGQQVTGFGINVIPLIVLGLLWRPRAVSAPPSAALPGTASAGVTPPAP